MWIFWLVASGIFFIIEIATVGFLIFWLGIGALLAMITSLITDNIIIQTAVFVVSSSLLIPLTKPFVDKFTKKDSTPTNSYSLLNRKVIVVSTIDPAKGTGLVKIDGETWSAKTENNSPILKDTEVKILSIEGVKLIVKPVWF